MLLHDTAEPVKTTWLDSFKNLIPVYAQYKTTKALTDLNIQRAKQGMEPISTQQYQAMAPAPQVQVGLDNSTQKMLMYGVGALAAILILPKLLKKRRG